MGYNTYMSLRETARNAAKGLRDDAKCLRNAEVDAKLDGDATELKAIRDELAATLDAARLIRAAR